MDHSREDWGVLIVLIVILVAVIVLGALFVEDD